VENWYRNNKSITIGQLEVGMVRELGLQQEDIFKSFSVVFEIPRIFGKNVVTNLLRFEMYWRIETRFEFILMMPDLDKYLVKK
jgi:hypothetical protein